jgi:hypothetical protein
LRRLSEEGAELTPTERTALMATDPEVWVHATEKLDPRLHKLSFPAGAAPADCVYDPL